MGGIGGGGWYRWLPASSRVERSVADATARSQYETEANTYLQELLADYNDRDVEAIQKHVDTLREAISSEVEGETSTLFGGSVKKHTYVDGLSDIDVLVVVNESSLADRSPQAVLRYFEERIKARLPQTEVKAGTLAVTIKFADGKEIQLLPALRTKAGVQIASADGSGWSNVLRPHEFARKLGEVNQARGGRVIPVIKLFKGMQDSLPDSNQVKSYHAESLAIEAFRNYAGRLTYKDMLLHFLRNSAQRVLSPINDTTGQSLHVDDYLGTASGVDRRRVSKALERLATRLATADSRASLEDLTILFEE